MLRPRVLVFSTISPTPVNRGDRLRLAQHLRHLASFAEVRLVYLERGWDPSDGGLGMPPEIDIQTVPIERHAVIREAARCLLLRKPSIVYRFHTRTVQAEMRRHFEEFRPDIFWAFQIDAFPLYPFARDCRRVIDLVDSMSLHYQLIKGQPKLPWRTRLALATQPRLRDAERLVWEQSDVMLVSSTANRRHLTGIFGTGDKLQTLFNSVAPEYLAGSWRMGDTRTGKLLFVGLLQYPPNEIGVRYFATHILPEVRKRLPYAELCICGKGSEIIQDLAELPGVRIMGFVPDLVKAYEEADVFVNPIPYASGIQNKLIEAMAVGTPCVVSRPSLDANGVTDGIQVLSADTPQEWAAHIERLVTDDALSGRLSSQGRKFIDQSFTPAQQREAIERLILGDVVNQT